MRNQIFIALALAACLPGYAARADFRLQTAAGSGASAVPRQADAPVSVATNVPVTADEAAAAPDKPRVPYARGFGHAVPLSFAARQIVPRNVAIRFGADVDQSAPVDWSGGRPWNVVIGAAVAPLHLHLSFSRTSMLIS